MNSRSHSDGGVRSHDRIPPELAHPLFAKAKELAANGLGGIRIARQLSEAYSLSVCPGTINHWIYGDHRPRVSNIFTPGPSPELSYIIGANIGDGCRLVPSGTVKLEVSDSDFADAFNSRMASLFHRPRPNKVLKRLFPRGRLPLYVVKYMSKQLTSLLSLPLREIFDLVFVFPREFLRGFFDAEGNVDVGVRQYIQLVVGAENSDLKLLLAVGRLLRERLHINGRIERKRVAGSMKVIRGKAFPMRRTSYTLIVGKLADVKRFARSVGFTIRRKSQKLEDALMIFATVEAKKRPAAWRKIP